MSLTSFHCRVWDMEDKVYRTPEIIDLWSDPKQIQFKAEPGERPEAFFLDERFVFERDTFHKDMNGNPIHEGDIVECSFFIETAGIYGAWEVDVAFKGEMCFDKKHSAFAFRHITDWEGCVYDKPTEMLVSDIPNCDEQERYRVIGNIHEKLELLEE